MSPNPEADRSVSDQSRQDRPIIVICMKWGTAYGAHDANVLHNMVRRHMSLPFRFVCFTDDATGLAPEIEALPLPDIHVPPAYRHAAWRKIALLKSDLMGLKGRALFLDLDLVITGSLDEIATYSDKIGIAENWTQPGRGIGNSSVFTWDIGQYGYIFDRYNETMDTLFQTYPNSQTFFSRTAGERGDMEWFPPEWVRSFKVDCMAGGLMNWVRTPTLPEGAKIVAFPGAPKPVDAVNGQYPTKAWYKKLYKHCRPTPWVKEHWR